MTLPACLASVSMSKWTRRRAASPARRITVSGSARRSPGTISSQIPPLAQRANEGREIGQSGKPEGAAPEAVKGGWAKAFGRLS